MSNAFKQALSLSNDLDFLTQQLNMLYIENQAQMLWLNDPNYCLDDGYIDAHSNAIKENIETIKIIQSRIDYIECKSTK